MSNLTFLGFQLPLTFDQFDIVKVFIQRVLGLVAIGAWAWDMALNGGKIRRTPVDWLILAFLAWVALSAVFSIHPPTAVFGKYRRFEGLLSFVNYALIYFLVLQYADRPSRIRTLAQTVFWAGVVVAGYGVLQSLGRDIVRWGKLPFEVNRAFSTYGNPDLLGGFLMFSVFISIGLALAEERLSWRAVYWTGFLLNMWCIVVAFTRSAWVGSVVGFFFLVLLAVRQRVPWKPIDWGFAGTIGALVAAIVVRSLVEPQRGHELRQASRLDPRVRTRAARRLASRSGRPPATRFRIGRSSDSAPTRSGWCSPSTSRPSTWPMPATSRWPTTCTTTRCSWPPESAYRAC